MSWVAMRGGVHRLLDDKHYGVFRIANLQLKTHALATGNHAQMGQYGLRTPMKTMVCESDCSAGF